MGRINNVENPVVRGHVDNHDNNKLSTVPSVDMNVNSEVCKPDDRGWCVKHNCEMQKIKVSVYKWRDRGNGRGFGNVKVKVPKFICMAKDITHVVPDISTSVKDLPGRPVEHSRNGTYDATRD